MYNTLMTIHRFFVSQVTATGDKIILQGDISWQIIKVLRLKVGDTIVLFDGTGKEHSVILENIEKHQVIGILVNTYDNLSEPQTQITLYQALTPREKFETILQKGTEIGVASFVPIETTRSLVKVRDIKEEKIRRWEKIIQEATEQSERGKVPTLEKPVSFEEAITQGVKKGIVYIAWEDEKENDLNVFSKDIKEESIGLFIGPEGGFTPEEILYAQKMGAITISLGPRILRTETAGPFMAAIVLFIKGDLTHKRASY